MSQSTGHLASLSLGLLFGLGLGWLLGGGSAPVAQASTGALKAAAGPSSGAGPATPAGLAAPAASSAGERSVAMAQPVAVQVDEALVMRTVQAALAEQMPPTASAGSGRVEGVVLDYLGSPVAGVQVQLLQYRGQQRRARSLEGLGGLALPESLEESVMGTAEDWARSTGGRRVVETDEGGGFAFEELPEGSWSLSAGLEGWKISRVNSRPAAVATGAQVDFEAVPRVPIQIDVLGLGGEPLEEATLELHSNGGNATHYAWTRSAPELNLSPGTYTVRAISEAQDWPVDDGKWMSDSASEELELRVLLGDAPRSEVLQLLPRAGIYGRVALPREALESNSMRVDIAELTDGAEATPDVFGDGNDGVRLYSEASFGFMDLEPGRYAVGFIQEWRGAALVVETVEVSTGLVRVDLTVEAPEAKPALTATVVDSDGRPVHDVHFRWMRKEGNSSSSGGATSKLLPAGGYRITPDEERAEGYWERSGGSELEFSLTATSPSQGRQTLVLRPGQTEVTFQLSEPAELEVTVMGYDAARYGGRMTIMVMDITEPGSNHYFFDQNSGIDSAGVQRFEGLTPGKKKVQLHLEEVGRNRGWGGKQIASQEVTIAPGFNRATIAMPALGELRVRAPDLSKGTHLNLVPKEGGNSAQAQTDEDGIALFEDLPHGDYVLSSWSVEGSQEVRVPSSEVLWEPRSPTGMRIETLEAKHPLALAGMAVGDLLLEVDGETVEQNTIWSKLYALSTQPSSTAAFLYSRGSERRTAELRGSQVVQDSIGQGVKLVPVFD